MNNIILDVDSYKVGMFRQYPKGTEFVSSYIEARGSKDPDYNETVFFGMQYFLKEYLSKPITQEMIDEAEEIYALHGEPFNKIGWEMILTIYGGYLPLEIQAVPEGFVVPTGNVLVQVVNTDPEFFWLTTWVETALLRTIWYATSVASNSYTIKKLLEKFYVRSGSVDGLDFKLHDFGSRGVSSKESAGIGGLAHLINFRGTDTIEALLYGRKYYNEKMAGFSIPACYDEETDILTENGWFRFADLTNEKVAQYNEDGTIDFVYPSKYYKSMYNGNMVAFTTKTEVAKVDLLVTPDHRMVRRSKATNNIEIQKANISKFSHRNKWIQGGVTNTKSSNLSWMDKLKIAFQADGSFPSRKEDYTGEVSGKLPIRFHLKKERKVTRLLEILDNINCEYTVNIQKDKYYSFWIKLDEKLSKVFDWIDLTHISQKWCADFCEELKFWDGTLNSNTIIYSTTEEYNIHKVQEVAILGGFRAKIGSYKDKRENRKLIHTINISKTNYRLGNGIKKDIIRYNGMIYCVTVPSGMVVVRRNGAVSISGNSEHSTMTSWNLEYDAVENMFEANSDYNIIACVGDSYNIYEMVDYVGTHMKDKIINSGKTFVIRPDSGDPTKVPIEIIHRLMKYFGYTVNDKGYKTLPSCIRVIQGDGITKDSIKDILTQLQIHTLSLDNLAFGMGSGLLQQVNRDTFGFAMKASNITINGEDFDVFKDPVHGGKVSKKGILGLYHNENDGFVTERYHPEGYDNLRTVYFNGDIGFFDERLETIRQRSN